MTAVGEHSTGREDHDPRLTDADAARTVAAINSARGAWAPGPHTTAAEVRARGALPVGEPPPEIDLLDVVVAGASDGLLARVYAPHRRAPAQAALLYLHGGGWVMGGLDANQSLGAELSTATGVTLVSVDYRLAPEHPYPAALTDATDALRWLSGGGLAALGLHTPRVALVGHSAGGALAAALARRSRDGKAPAIVHQALLSPVLDHDLTRASYLEYGDGKLLLGTAEMRWYWERYAPDTRRRDEPDASPLRASDLAGLAPATIVAGGADPLRDEAVEYARRAQRAGVDARLMLQPGVPHLFLQLPAIRSRLRVIAEVARALRSALGVVEQFPSPETKQEHA